MITSPYNGFIENDQFIASDRTNSPRFALSLRLLTLGLVKNMEMLHHHKNIPSWNCSEEVFQNSAKQYRDVCLWRERNTAYSLYNGSIVKRNGVTVFEIVYIWKKIVKRKTWIFYIRISSYLHERSFYVYFIYELEKTYAKYYFCLANILRLLWCFRRVPYFY